MKDYKYLEEFEQENLERCKNCISLETCETKGFIVHKVEWGGRIYDVYEKCSKRKKFETEMRYQRALRSSGLPKDYLNKTFDNFNVGKNKSVVEKIKQYLSEERWKEGKGLIITGKTGVGKTHLASAIVHELSKQDVFVLFIFVPDFLDEIRDSYDEEQEQEESKFELAKNARVLILDDLGTERITDWTIEKITQLLNYRYSNSLATIVTTNYVGQKLKERIGERAYSRLMGMCEEILILGEDWRLKRAIKNED